MKKKKNKCQNKSCGCLFVPSKFHPNQKYCNCKKCLKYAGRKRQQKHYNKNLKNEEFQRELSKRKARERLRRKEREEEVQNALKNVSTSKELSNTASASLLGIHFFKGLLSFQTGSSDAEEIDALICKCHDRGKELTLNHPGL